MHEVNTLLALAETDEERNGTAEDIQRFHRQLALLCNQRPHNVRYNIFDGLAGASEGQKGLQCLEVLAHVSPQLRWKVGLSLGMCTWIQ